MVAATVTAVMVTLVGVSPAVAADPPLATTEAATKVGNTGATLNGKVNPNGAAVATCRFEYGTTLDYGAALPCVPASLGTGNFNVAVSAEVGSLESGTTYHYRVVASSVNGATQGSGRSFTTTGIPACANAGRRFEQGILAIQLLFCMALEQVYPSLLHPSLSGGSYSRQAIVLTIVLGWLMALAVTSMSSSAFAAASCPNEAIRQQQGSSYLPECMALEQVSPPVKYSQRAVVDDLCRRAVFFHSLPPPSLPLRGRTGDAFGKRGQRARLDSGVELSLGTALQPLGLSFSRCSVSCHGFRASGICGDSLGFPRRSGRQRGLELSVGDQLRQRLRSERGLGAANAQKDL